MEIIPVESNPELIIWKKGDSPDWTKSKYLVIELIGNNDYGGTINIEFYKELGKTFDKKIILQS